MSTTTNQGAENASSLPDTSRIPMATHQGSRVSGVVVTAGPITSVHLLQNSDVGLDIDKATTPEVLEEVFTGFAFVEDALRLLAKRYGIDGQICAVGELRGALADLDKALKTVERAADLAKRDVRDNWEAA